LKKEKSYEEINGDAVDGSNRLGRRKRSSGSAQGLLPFG
jgi:hypothetical protein